MTEDEAQAWITGRFGEPAHRKLKRLVSLVGAEASRQNLIARSTLDAIWSRHIVDSAQLLDLVPAHSIGSLWLDIGTGPGFPAW